MRRFLRPFSLTAFSALLLLGAAAVVFQARPAANRPLPLPVAAGDREIAWLYPATSATAWERFVSAVRQVAERLEVEQPGFQATIGPKAFPPQTVAVPEVALMRPDGGRLVFRWYKLTSGWKTRDWVEALLQRARPPLAIIGGSSSHAARELARQLAAQTGHLPESDRPVLLLTTATADRVSDEDAPSADVDTEAGEGLNRLYPGRTFRFCFTNRQMAAAVTQFLWSRDDLRPDADPVHMVRWKDDSYSLDLIDGFWQALRTLATRETANDWAWFTGCVAHSRPMPLAGGILPASRAGPDGSSLRMHRLSVPQLIDSSVGTFHAPNPFEAQAARFLLLDMANGPPQRRPLLIVTGQAAPSRRFLRTIARSDPIQARRLVIATGDAISFTTIYRDRRIAWPVQDLPFSLVLFSHHNPIDPAAGFRPQVGRDETASASQATGTEDLLLYGKIIESLARSTAGTTGDAARLTERLSALRLSESGRLSLLEGVPLFTAEGNRRSGTGEHVVCLRPSFARGRILPEAVIEVWAWRAEAIPAWQPVGVPLTVTYDEGPTETGGGT